MISGWTLILDANFLFSILGIHANPENEACLELVNMVINEPFNFKLRYLPETLEEVKLIKEFMVCNSRHIPFSLANALYLVSTC